MKIVTLDWYWGRRMAFVFGDRLVDLNGAYAAYLHQVVGIPREAAYPRAKSEMPANIVAMLQIQGGLDRAGELAEWISRMLDADPERLASITWNFDEVKFAPTVPNPSKIWCQGANYRDHKLEMASRMNTDSIPDRLRGFLKAPSALIGAFDDIIYPSQTTWVEHEIELAAVIGKPARYVPEERALDYVAGYVAFNDISSRDIPKLDQGRMDRGKGFDTFAVMGPWMVTKDEIPDPYNLTLKLLVNGQNRQNGNTRDMIFSISNQIAWLSRSMTLLPGDVISTGTPSGTGRIEIGDVLEGSVEHLGYQRNRVIGDSMDLNIGQSS